MAQAVLFDLDGVLVDTYDVWHRLMRDVAARLGYPDVSRADFHTTWGQGTEADREAFYRGHTIKEIRRLYLAHYEDHLEALKPMPGVEEFLKGLTLPKAVVTNSLRRMAIKSLRIAGLEAHFPIVLGGDDVAHSKPAPDMLLEACRRLSVAPAEAVMVGDSRYDEEAARAAGTPFALFTSFSTLKL